MSTKWGCLLVTLLVAFGAGAEHTNHFRMFNLRGEDVYTYHSPLGGYYCARDLDNWPDKPALTAHTPYELLFLGTMTSNYNIKLPAGSGTVRCRVWAKVTGFDIWQTLYGFAWIGGDLASFTLGPVGDWRVVYEGTAPVSGTVINVGCATTNNGPWNLLPPYPPRDPLHICITVYIKSDFWVE